ncbi:TerB family tellurite resistance protein [Hydrogenophaga sp.]|uniref:TerB family tellurite resistance protein n=1 Tax=Hydrogenophaga sp. TaxID=1904254 RepID=UPI0027182EC9|nr:TerB family tellurite resistance protein [Hydrogenophaga sp.]MDO9435495.1 TerB family tellurite resistance protein [Hydrogenophaga sp.]
MRTYRTNSPEASARLLAMALVADGNYSLTEIRALDRLKAPEQLGLSSDAFKDVIETFCEDLLNASQGEWTGSARMDASMRQQLLAEVQDPALRKKLVALCHAIVHADGHEAHGETALLDTLTFAWLSEPKSPQPTGARA